MGWEAYAVLALTFGSLLLLVLGKAELDAVGLGVIIALVTLGILPLEKALKGFSNSSVITIGALYVIGEGLTRTGALEFLAQWVLRKSSGSERRMLFLTTSIAAFVSAFINDTAVVVVFIPVIIGIARTTGIPASRLLMPMSFAALLGGMCTLVGTSTNLLVSGAATDLGERGITMFDMTPVAVPLVALNVLFMTLFARKLLPVRQSLTMMMAETEVREYVTELVIGPSSKLIGRTFAEAFSGQRIKVVLFVRNESTNMPPFDEIAIQVGDAIVVRGSVDDLADMQTRLGLKLVGEIRFDPHQMQFFELAVSPRSSFKGRKVGDLYLYRDYGAIPIAVMRAGQHIQQRVSELVIQAGDLLLACGDDKALVKLGASTDFYLVTGAQKQIVLRSHAKRSLWITLAVIMLFSLNSIFQMKSVQLPMVALAGAIVTVASGCVSARRTYRSIGWDILFFIVGMLALGKALEETGAAGFLAHGFVTALEGLGPSAMIAGFVVLCTLFNFCINHSATAVLLTPIAIDAARQYAEQRGWELASAPAQALIHAFVLSIAFGGSICFATPFGHQVNLFVIGPGGYRYADFLRFGLPVSLITCACVATLLPLVLGL